MSAGMLRSALILGLLSCVGPLSIDMYLPALPTVADHLDSTVGAVQMTLTVFFIAFGASQLVYGPIADQVGRKPPLYFGLAIFILGSVGCAMAPNIEVLMAARFVQGLGAAVLMVIPRAIIRDLHTGVEATRLMALIMLVISVSPMLAPLAGSGMILLAGWRSIFLLLCVAAVCSLLLTGFMLPETLKPENRVVFNRRSFMKGARTLLTDTEFMGLTFIGGFGMASFFVFIASASFVYSDQFGLSPTGFSIAFAINAIGFFAASQTAAGFGKRFGMARVVSAAVAGFCVLTIILFALTLAGYGSLVVIVGFLFAANACLGLVIPTTMVLALDNHGDIAGLASSLGGTLQMVAGGAMIAAASPFFDGTATPMIAAITLCGIAAFVLSRLIPLREGIPEAG
ncbi:multidrug effflux MFS transporter [Hoeflea prorocentri]|uniref:Bcr/CflA family efflux transporter n=1 Tax=Hoeflea prorocentri TaxID=1922333 RepID=A0A9X3ZFW5_9HYPH|nr:multidrug effflux MFS transporter [Hoeflea prorocentri]MCY6379185.1 multidrug effflux MFS transporter [Hoeflea prorocentri]MDA5396986.1 multidrug effflux MFS transporter [Hoeflea prorocentri]